MPPKSDERFAVPVGTRAVADVVPYCHRRGLAVVRKEVEVLEIRGVEPVVAHLPRKVADKFAVFVLYRVAAGVAAREPVLERLAAPVIFVATKDYVLGAVFAFLRPALNRRAAVESPAYDAPRHAVVYV